MRVFKPLQPSLQTRPFGWAGEHRLAVTVLLGFPFNSNAPVLLEQDLWRMLPERLAPGAILDMGMPKPQGEVLVFGDYHAPGARPVGMDQVRLRCGGIDKQLTVVGTRYWGLLGPSSPVPFTELALTYDNAYGGSGYGPNPIGKGRGLVDVYGEMRRALPNIDDPALVAATSHERPGPVGFGPLDVTWEQRASRAGTYDQTWLQDHFPGYPPDLDWNHFNAAPPDQWIDGFWRGDETFALTNMHPGKPSVDGRLPAFRSRCFVEKPLRGEVRFTEVEMHAETVFLFPGVETGVLLFRGTTAVSEDDAGDVRHLLLAYEDLAQPPRDIEHYETALRNRLDDSQVFRYAMSTVDLIPERERCGFARLMDDAGESGEHRLATNLDARLQAQKDEALQTIEARKEQLRATLLAGGVDPEPVLAKVAAGHDAEDPLLAEIMALIEQILPGSTGGDVARVRVEQVDFSKFDELNRKLEEMADARKSEARAQLEAVIERARGTPGEDEVVARVERVIRRIDEPPPLPRPPDAERVDAIAGQLARAQQFREQAAAETQPLVVMDADETAQKVREASAGMRDLYRDGAHHVEGTPPHTVPMDIVQHRFDNRVADGKRLAGRDWAGVNAAGRDLAQADLSNCYLEYADLSGADLRRASLRGAIVTHANLSGANLAGADVERANLGAGDLSGADLTGAKLSHCVLAKSRLRATRLVDCELDDVDFLEADLAGADLGGSRVAAAIFLDMDLTGARFAGTTFVDCNFLQCTLTGADFTGSDLSGCNFVECTLDGAVFEQARMSNARFLGACSLSGCRFTGAVLDRVNLRDTRARDCDFEGASFEMADFSGADLGGGKFYGARGKRALFMKTDLGGADMTSVDLMEGSLLKARLTGASLRHSNLYAVEFLNATVGGTDFTGANLDRSKLQDWRPSE